MNRLHCFFAAAALVLAFLVIGLIVREYDTPWRTYQQEYKTSLQQRADSPTRKEAARRFAVKIRQDWLPELERADRCRTCHLGVADPDAPRAQPLAAHPPTPHLFRTFGCTVCHDGAGYAVREQEAHARRLPMQVIEASCGKCHDGTIIREQAPTLAAGQVLAKRYNCNGCHDLADRKRRHNSGPDLNGIGLKVSGGWLINWLRDPAAWLDRARMGNFLLSGEEQEALAAFLTSVPFQNKIDFLAEEEADARFLDGLDDDAYDELVDQGKVLFGRLRCLSCHSLHGRGGSLGPELERIGRKSSGRWLRAWLKAPRLYDPETIMPTFRLSRAERVGLAEYLLLESDYLDENKETETPEPVFTDEQRIRGARLFVTRGCFNCHALRGVPNSGEFAPSLADLAGRKIDKISFGEASVPHTLPDYIAAKLQAPRIFGPNLKMPKFPLTPEETGRLTTFALAQSATIPPGYQRKEQKPPFAVSGPVGRLFDRYRCLSCHRIRGSGGALAPDLSDEGSKVERNWLISYLRKPYAIRPTLTERMLRLNMTEKEAALLADYISLVLRNNEIDAFPQQAGGDPARGKDLYYGRYNCQSCHGLGTGGGYFGPALDRVGARLRPAWLHARLDNGHRFEEDGREPVLAVPKADRADLVAFLMTLTGDVR